MESTIIVDYLGRMCLFTLHIPFLVPFILIGYFSKYRPIFTRCLFILLFTLVLNPYLKTLFKVPLMPHLGEGYAFPSGHMQIAIAFWGWLAFEFKKPWLYILILSLLTCIGLSLVHFNYHHDSDVMGSVIFGMLTWFVFYGLYDLFKKVHKSNAYIGLSLIVLCVPILVLMPTITLSMWAYTSILILFTAMSYWQGNCIVIPNFLTRVKRS